MFSKFKESFIWMDLEFELLGTEILYQYLKILRDTSLNLIYYNLNQLKILHNSLSNSKKVFTWRFIKKKFEKDLQKKVNREGWMWDK